MVGDGARDRLAYPPGGVGGELEAFAIVEFLHGPDEPGVALLDEVEQIHVLRVVILGDGDDQAQVGLDHAVFGPSVARLDALGELDLFVPGEERDASRLLSSTA